MLTKTVLFALPDGACKLVEVEFSWTHGDALPASALEQYFPNVPDAMSELANRGRASARVHVPKPEKPEKKNAEPSAVEPRDSHAP